MLGPPRRGDERAARAWGIVELMREVYAQEKNLVELRKRMHDTHPSPPPFQLEWAPAPSTVEGIDEGEGGAGDGALS